MSSMDGATRDGHRLAGINSWPAKLNSAASAVRSELRV
jgi:hypothetical protein